MGRQPTEMPVEQVLRLAAHGDAAAWETLVGRYTPRLYGLLVNQCRDKELAEELTQVTFVKVVQKLDKAGGYEESGRFDAWLFRIAMNALRDEMRRRKRQATPTDMGPGASSGRDEQSGGWSWAQQTIVSGGPSVPDDPSEAAVMAEQVKLLSDAVQQLSPADQEIIHLRHSAGLSFAQIAKTLEQPLGTVLSRGHRALGKLKKLMTEPDALNSSTDTDKDTDQDTQPATGWRE